MRRPLRIAMLAHSTNPRGGVVHAMQLAEALAGLGQEAVLHAPDASGAGFFRAPKCEARPFPVSPAKADMGAMVEQRIADYVAHFSEPENRGFDLWHAHDGISGNALATLKSRGLIGGFVRTVHHIDDFADQRLSRLQDRAIREADGWMVVERSLARPPPGGLRRRRGRLRQWRRRRPLPSPVRTEGSRTFAAGCGLGPDPYFCAWEASKRARIVCASCKRSSSLHAVRPDAELVIAGGASLLDHGQYQAEFERRLASMGAARRRGAPSRRDRRPRHAAALPAGVRARLRLGERRLRALRAGSDGERHSRDCSLDCALHRLPVARGRRLVRSPEPEVDRRRNGARASSGLRPPACAAKAARSPRASTGARWLRRMSRCTAAFGSAPMPEMWFVVRRPDGASETCYSPSLVIKDYFREGETYGLPISWRAPGSAARRLGSGEGENMATPARSRSASW